MISTILADLKTIIESISGVQKVYIYEPQEIEKYPAVILTVDGHEDSYKSLRDTERNLRIRVRTIAELTSTYQESQAAVVNLAETISNTITNTTNVSLSGDINFTRLTSGETRFIVGDNKLFLYDFVYTASMLINRGS